MILKEKFHNAYVVDSYTQQYENYQKIADDWAKAFGYYLEEILDKREKEGLTMEKLLEKFKEFYTL